MLSWFVRLRVSCQLLIMLLLSSQGEDLSESVKWFYYFFPQRSWIVLLCYMQMIGAFFIHPWILTACFIQISGRMLRRV